VLALWQGQVAAGDVSPSHAALELKEVTKETTTANMSSVVKKPPNVCRE
jgi:hypothetical protein